MLLKSSDIFRDDSAVSVVSATLPRASKVGGDMFESVVDEGPDPLVDMVGSKDLAQLEELSHELILHQLRLRYGPSRGVARGEGGGRLSAQGAAERERQRWLIV